MNKVSLCLILDKTHHQTIYCFEQTGFTIVEKEEDIIKINEPKQYAYKIYGVEVELIIGYTQHTSKTTIEYFKPFANELIDVSGLTKYEAYNYLFSKATLDLVCVYALDIILQKNWLLELVFYTQAVNKSGIVSICSELNGLNCYSLIGKDEEVFHSVYMPSSEVITNESLYIFYRQYLYLIGGFDTENDLYGNEFAHLQLRYSYEYFNNYYIPTQSAILLNNNEQLDKNRLITGSQKAKESINFMKKNRSFYVPLKQYK